MKFSTAHGPVLRSRVIGIGPRSVCRFAARVPWVLAVVRLGSGAGFEAGSFGVAVNAQSPSARAGAAALAGAVVGAALASAGAAGAPPEGSVTTSTMPTRTRTTTPIEVITA